GRGADADRHRQRFRRPLARTEGIVVITINTGFAMMPAKAATAELSATDWAVLHAIALHADKDGRAFPSMGRISAITGIKRHHVARAIGRIEQRRLMRHDRVPRPNGGWQA